MLWLAAPVTGLLVQPIVGALSDRTWGPLGRRRPYFLVGAILASIALFFMPTSSALWMAASLLWILDASINISMEPFRAFVADKLDASQRTAGFVMQSFFIGIGAIAGQRAAVPVPRRWASAGSTASGIPLTVKYSFQAGAVVFLLAVLWTVFTTTEHPPEDMAAFEREKRERRGVGALFGEIGTAIAPDAPDHEAAGRRPVLYLAGPVLHVDVLRPHRGARTCSARRDPQDRSSTRRGSSGAG